MATRVGTFYGLVVESMACVVDMMELLSDLLQLLTACLVLFSGIVVGLDRHRVIFDHGMICK